MSVKLVAKTHPFDPTSRIVREAPCASLGELYASLGLPLPLENARFSVNDLHVTDPAFVPSDGDMVFINVVPGGDTKAQGVGSKIGGAALIVGGVVLGVLTAWTGIGAAGAAALIGSGISLFAGGVVLYHFQMPGTSSREQAQTANYLRGSQNQTDKGGPVSIVLGRHRIAPKNAASPYTEIAGNDQYFHQLFAVSTSDCEIDPDSWKIGDTLLSTYKAAEIEVVSDGSSLAQYPEIVRETSIGQELKNVSDDGSSGALTFTTPTKTNRIIVDIAFNGLVAYDDDGNKKDASVQVRAEYKVSGLPDAEYKTLGHWSGTSDVISSQSTRALRAVISRDLDNTAPGGADFSEDKQYDVRLTRVSGDSTDASVIDKVYWGSLRSVQFERPISARSQGELCIAALRIKASGQLNGVVSELSCVASSVVRDWDGLASGPAHWVAAQTANPASLYLYVLTSSRVNPRPTGEERIDWPAFEAWHEFCKAKEYECNLVVSEQYDRDSLLDLIAQCGRATGVNLAGKKSVVVDKERSSPMQMITPRNSWGYSGSKAFPDFPHALKVNFVDKNLDYAQSQLVVYDDDYNEDGSLGKSVATSFQEIDATGVTSSDQAWRTGRYKIAAAHLRCESHEVSCDFEYLTSTLGDRVLFSHDVIRVGLSYTRIVSVIKNAGLIEGINVDEELQIEDGQNYAVSIRTTLGILTLPVTADVGITKSLALVNPVSETRGIEEDNLVAFGYPDLVTEDVIVSDISPQDDLTAKLTLVNYAPELFTLLDDPNLEIPPFETKMSKPGSRNAPAVITSLYDLEEAVRDAKETALSPPNNPTYGELQGGYSSGGGTMEPAAPSLEASSGFRSVMLLLDTQVALTNFSSFELQVSEDAAGPWYSLRQDGYDWKGDVGSWTLAPVEMFVHANIPLAGTADAPLARVLWYRARRTTKAALKSAWSTAVQAFASPAQSGDLVAGSVTANKLAAGILEALQAVIHGDVIIDKDLGFLSGQTGEVEGNEQAYLREDEVVFRRFWGGSWHTLVRLALEGLYAQQHYSDGPLVISNGTNATRRARGMDLGRPYPSANARVYHFDGDVLDQLGTAGWTIAGSYNFDADDLAILAMAPFTLSGASLYGDMALAMSLGAELFGDWWVDLWFKLPDTGDNFDILSIGNSVNGASLHFQESAIAYTDPALSGELPYTDPGASGQKPYVTTKAGVNLSIVSMSSGISSSVRRLIPRGTWVHAGLGFIAATNTLHVVLGTEDIQFPLFHSSGPDAVTITLNAGRMPGLKFDEVFYDFSSPIDSAIVASETNEHIPWAANDYSKRVMVLEAFDPDLILTNIVQSGGTAAKRWIKYPGKVMEQWGSLSIALPVAAAPGADLVLDTFSLPFSSDYPISAKVSIWPVSTWTGFQLLSESATSTGLSIHYVNATAQTVKCTWRAIGQAK